MSGCQSVESVSGRVFDSSTDAREHGKGGIWYTWKPDSKREFPRDVSSVFICMPVQWGFVCAEWTVDRKNQCGAQWSLSGTIDKPTLSPSLHWIGMWHGWLRDGELISC